MDATAPSPAGWSDWRWQQRHVVDTLAGFEACLDLVEEERRGIEAAVARGARFGATPYYLSLADRIDPFCPVRMQIVPDRAEGIARAGELADPLGEETSRRARCLVHRYPDRALLLVTDRCAVYCRHCTRRRLTLERGLSEATLDDAVIDEALAYLAAHREIREVIVSGGDPLLLSDDRLDDLLTRLRRVGHLKIIRIGTRMPVANPMRVTTELASLLRGHAPLFVLTQFNHPKECAPEAEAACAALVDRGVPVENQAVLLRRVNSSARLQTALSQRLLEMRVRPYYLHQMDVVEGAERFRTPLAKGIEILDAMRGRASGLAIPHFAVDLPGGGGKVTLQSDRRLAMEEGRTLFRNWRGERFAYPEPAEIDCACPAEARWFGRHDAEAVPSDPCPAEARRFESHED